MNIEQTKGNNYSQKKTFKSDSSSAAKRADSNSDTPAAAGASSPKGDAANVSLSGTTFKDEIDFTRNILGNSRKQSLDSLKKIKQKISSGDYNSQAVHKKISGLVNNDLSSLKNLLIKTNSGMNPSSGITQAHKNRLLENPRVTKKIADTIARDLQNL